MQQLLRINHLAVKLAQAPRLSDLRVCRRLAAPVVLRLAFEDGSKIR